MSLSVSQLSVSRGQREVLRDVGFELGANEVLAIVGPNGAGKTTLLEAVLGALPHGGRVRFAGAEVQGFAATSRLFSWMPDAAEPPEEVGVDALVRWFEQSGRSPSREALKIDALGAARAGELSRGEKRRLLLYGALCAARPVTVLDEPLGAFDPLQVRSVVEVLRAHAKERGAIIATVHQLSDAEKLADRILILDAGRPVALGTLEELRSRAGLPGRPLEDVFVALLERGAS